MLTAPAPGRRSKALWLIGLVVLALLVAGGVLFLLLRDSGVGGGEEPVVETTGPGSFGEPHSSESGVAVFYPDGEVNQRWIVEVVEPVQDLTGSREIGGDGIPATTRIRILNESGVEGASLADLSFNAISESGQIFVREQNSCPFSVDDLDFAAVVPIGAQVEGDVCWSIPAADLVGLRLGVESSKVNGRIHILIG